MKESFAGTRALTVVAVAVVACAAADMVHEALGHGLACGLAGDRILSLSTVALQNATPNRFVAACGTSANLLVGGLALLALRRLPAFTAAACFLWLFGAFNLFNTGYLLFSALSGSGDWAFVIAGLQPSLLWRGLIGLAGAALYALAMGWTAAAVLRFVENGSVALRDLRRVATTSYVAGGVLLTAASLFNPIGPGLVLTAGLGASFGLNAGLLWVPGIVAKRAHRRPDTGRPLPSSPAWLVLGLVVAAAFIGILGPGIRLPGP